MNKLFKNEDGFSLVELIVVIAIMVILIAMLVPNVVGYIKKATWATEQNGAATVFSAAQTYVTDYYAKHGELATTCDLGTLKDENLLTKEPKLAYEIHLNPDVAAIDSVTWESTSKPDDVTTPTYPIEE